MKKRKRNLLIIAGVISTIMGMLSAIPFALQEKYWAAGVAGVFIIVGLIILAIAFGE